MVQLPAVLPVLRHVLLLQLALTCWPSQPALAGDVNVPKWPPTYNMSLSTIIMPCDNNELMSSGPNWPIIRGFGVIDIDWSNSKEMWINTDPMACEENLLKQAQLIKAKNPLGEGQKVWVDALPFLSFLHSRKENAAATNSKGVGREARQSV